MNSLNIIRNKYGDLIIKGNSFNITKHLEENQYSGSVVLKSSDSFEEIPDNFSFVTIQNDIFIYLNKIALEQCAYVNDDGCVNGTIVTLFIHTKYNTYAVFVKDRTKRNVTNVSGSLKQNETLREGAIRECLEETGLKIATLIECGKSKTKYTMYNTIFEYYTTHFVTHINVDNNQFNQLLTFSNEEIEKIILIPCNDLLNNISYLEKKYSYPVADHHYYITQFEYIRNTNLLDKYEKLRDKKFSYLLEFEIY